MGYAPACAREALDMVRAGLGYLAAADAAQLSAATQAECLRELEQDDAVATAARASILAAFTAGQGYAGDADYSAVSWLMHRTGITRGRSARPGQAACRASAARGPRLATTVGGAGVVHGDLTPARAEVGGRVLAALSAPAGKEDDRTRAQRYHDALAEAMRRLVASG